jgi:molecular chaperone GrpE
MRKDKDRFEIPIDDAADADKLLIRIAELEQQLATAEETAAEAKVDLLRRAADLDNTRKRLARDHERACAAAALDIVARLVPLIADLHRMIEGAGADAATPQHLLEALRMYETRLADVLKAEGLEPIPCERGDAFDPEVHEAVMTTCEPDLPVHAVARVLEAGYNFRGSLLKPVKVAVCTGPAEEDGGGAAA